MKLARLPAPLLMALVQWATAEGLELDWRSKPAYRWMNPFPEDGLVRRQSGYHPEFGGCDYTGETCEEACGSGYEECSSGTELALFCYDTTRDQKCCPDDSGRACDRGFYCAKGRDRTWCCPEGLSIADCEALFSEELTSLDSNPSPTSDTSRFPTDTTTTSSGGNDHGGSPSGASTTATETVTETLTISGENAGGTATVIRTTILAPLTETFTQLFTVTFSGAVPGSEQTVTVTSEITRVNTQTIILGGGGGDGGDDGATVTVCSEGEATCGGGPVVVTASPTSSGPAVISEAAAPGSVAPDGFGTVAVALLGVVPWALGVAL